MALFGIGRERITAVDLDRTCSPSDDLALTIRGVDFLRWASDTEQRFDRIVGNPPYVAIKRLPPSLQRSAISISDLSGHPIGRGANTWLAFVLASLKLLKPGGCLAFVLPSAAEFADYSAAMRRAVRSTFASLEVFRCKRPLFQGVQEGTVVAIARGYGSHPCMIHRKRFETPTELVKGLSHSNCLNGHQCPTGITRSDPATTALGSVAEIRVGGVTGDVSYFLMTEQRRQALELPKSALTPVVSKAKHLAWAALGLRHWNKLKSSGARIWLFNPSAALEKNPNVQRYLHLESAEGGCNQEAYKVSIREPWYRTPLPQVPDAFLSGMSRHGPWLCINRMKRLNATNTLYVVTFRDRDPDAWYMWALALLSSFAERQIRRIGRRYADGLIKYEPGPLAEIRLPKLKRRGDYRRLYTEAVAALLRGERVPARAIADAQLC